MNKTRGRGRPPGASHTREQILDVARRRFLDEGYDRVTMRSVAAEAGVDAALISYFFGSKRGLFGAALALPVNPAEVLAEALPGDLPGLGERILRAFLRVWDKPSAGAALRALAGGAVREPDFGRLLREVIGTELVGRIAARIGGADASRRAGVFGAQMAGLVFTRYVLAIEPVATMPADELVARLAPALRRTLAVPPPRHR